LLFTRPRLHGALQAFDPALRDNNPMSKQSCTDHRRYAAGCEVCRRTAREYERARRARRRGLEPQPAALVVVEPLEPDHDVVNTSAARPGGVELAVQDELDGLGVNLGGRALAAAALAMARILDDRRLATTQPSAARQLERLMAVLRREAAPRRGRLQVVQDMIGGRG
jgi:hypothetical protein